MGRADTTGARVDRVRLCAPSLRHVELGRNGYYFLATDTPKLMQFLADETRRAGAEIRFGSAFVGVTRSGGYLVLDGHGVGGRFLVGADGVHSKVAQATGLDRNTRLLKGVEWEYEPLERVGDCLHCFVDPLRAPGYIGWVVPGVGVTQVGLAVHQEGRADISAFVEHLDDRFGLHGSRVQARCGQGVLRSVRGPLTFGAAAPMGVGNRRTGDTIGRELLRSDRRRPRIRALPATVPFV